MTSGLVGDKKYIIIYNTSPEDKVHDQERNEPKQPARVSRLIKMTKSTNEGISRLGVGVSRL